jgi:hypothetical protein
LDRDSWPAKVTINGEELPRKLLNSHYDLLEAFGMSKHYVARYRCALFDRRFWISLDLHLIACSSGFGYPSLILRWELMCSRRFLPSSVRYTYFVLGWMGKGGIESRGVTTYQLSGNLYLVVPRVVISSLSHSNRLAPECPQDCKMLRTHKG